MAKFNTVGVEDFLRSLEEYGERASDAIPDLLNAGADVAQEAMESTAAYQDDTGQLRRSIKRSKVFRRGSASYIELYPSGKTADGERLEEIGFTLEHGRGYNFFSRTTKTGKTKTYVLPPMDPKPWMRPAIEDNADRIFGAIKGKWEEIMSDG